MIRRNNMLKSIILWIIVISLLLVFLFPIYWMFIASFKNNAILMSFPPHLYPEFKTVENYITILSNLKYLNYIKKQFDCCIRNGCNNTCFINYGRVFPFPFSLSWP